MNTFYGTFAAGMEEQISLVIKERLSDANITKLLSGAVIFETSQTYDKLNFFCFNNIFAVIDFLELPPASGENPLIRHINKIKNKGIPKKSKDVLSLNTKKIKTFRLVFSMENTPASVSEKHRKEMEYFIEESSSLLLNRSMPDTEFWFLYRREGFSVFMKRMTHSAEKTLKAGELSRQLAWLLCRLGSLKTGDIVLDPFCGYGSIPEAAIKYFPVKSFTALEIDPACIKITKNKKSLMTDRFTIIKKDFFSSGFRDESSFHPESFDAIITDPPWGHYSKMELSAEAFNEKMLKNFSILLKPNGRAVILTANELEPLIEKRQSLILKNKIPILVSGKKANIYVLHKT